MPSLSAAGLTGAAAVGDGRGGFIIEETTVRAPLAGEVRVALRAAEAGANQVVVAGDDVRIVQACEAHGVRARC